MCCEYICAKLRETRRRTMSPMTMPRTRPFGFCKATIRPRARLGTIASGTLPSAICWATAVSRCVASSSSSMSRSVSAVRPEGPGAAPFLVRRGLLPMVAVDNSGSWSGWNAVMSELTGWYGSCGRRAGSCSSCNVCSLPGAVGFAVRACRAAESSPRCTKCLALCARRSASASALCCRCWAAGGGLVWLRRWAHSPASNC